MHYLLNQPKQNLANVRWMIFKFMVNGECFWYCRHSLDQLYEMSFLSILYHSSIFFNYLLPTLWLCAPDRFRVTRTPDSRSVVDGPLRSCPPGMMRDSSGECRPLIDSGMEHQSGRPGTTGGGDGHSSNSRPSNRIQSNFGQLKNRNDYSGSSIANQRIIS